MIEFGEIPEDFEPDWDLIGDLSEPPEGYDGVDHLYSLIEFSGTAAASLILPEAAYSDAWRRVSPDKRRSITASVWSAHKLKEAALNVWSIGGLEQLVCAESDAQVSLYRQILRSAVWSVFQRVLGESRRITWLAVFTGAQRLTDFLPVTSLDPVQDLSAAPGAP